MTAVGEIEISKRWIKQVFVPCRAEVHAKCSQEFEYENELFTCQCECHQLRCPRCGASRSEGKFEICCM